MGIQDQTRACPVAPSPSLSDGRTGAPRPSGPTRTPEAATGPHSAPLPLSRVELDIVTLAAQGHTNRAIATQLHRSLADVKRHLATAGHRADCQQRAGIVAAACRAGLLDDLPGPARARPNVTPRLRSTLDGIAAGLTDRQIADREGFSMDGVRSRAKDLYAALGANGRANAVWIAHRHGMLREATR